MIVTKLGTLHEKAGGFEYKMSHAQAQAVLKQRKGTDANMPPKDYLVKYVNEEYNLLYNCVKVHVI